jgi:TonB family protein
LRELGGEREIERVASTVGHARDCEVWEPALGDVVANRMRRRSRSLRWGFSVFGAALAASFGIHALLAAGITPMAHMSAAPSGSYADATRVVLEQRSAPAYKTQTVAVAPPQRLIVTHNVVQIARAPLPAAAVDAFASVKVERPRQLIAETVHPNVDAAHPPRHSNVPVWRRRDDTQWRTVAQTTTTSVTETAPMTLTHSAESIQVAANYPTREVAPIGGETAINPQPPMIAYSEGAEGTTVFEVRVDERGNPTRCIITKSAGYPVLDDAVCKAAMRARYTPKMVEGRAVSGVYSDAFTFHMSDDSNEGIQTTIPAAGPYHNPNPRATDGQAQPSSPFSQP